MDGRRLCMRTYILHRARVIMMLLLVILYYFVLLVILTFGGPDLCGWGPGSGRVQEGSGLGVRPFAKHLGCKKTVIT